MITGILLLRLLSLMAGGMFLKRNITPVEAKAVRKSLQKQVYYSSPKQTTVLKQLRCIKV